MRRILSIVIALLLVCIAALWAFDRFFPEHAVQLMRDFERKRSGLEPGRMTIDGVDIAYLAGGHGEPLLLIHGFGADKDSFASVSHELTARYRVLIPDLPGFGESSRSADGDYSVAAQVERLRIFANRKGIERVHLGGISMGGWIAMEWALRHEDEVASLWLQAPAGTTAAMDSELGRLIEETGRNPLVITRADEYPELLDFVMSRPPAFIPSSIMRVMGERAEADRELRSQILKQLGDPDHDQRIVGLATPTLIVWGDEDRLLGVGAASHYAQAMPNAEALLLPGVGHVPMLEARQPVLQRYLQFRERYHIVQ